MDPVYVQLGPSKGLLHRPEYGRSTCAVLVMHRTMNFLHHPVGLELAARGFLVLCMNSRFENNEAQVRFEELALDVRAGVEYLRGYSGVKSVVLWGHSGGGPIMSFYQALAESGPGFSRAGNKLSPVTVDLAGAPPADGLILGDAHPGNPTMVMRGLDPAVREQADGTLAIDPSIDALAPSNGYDPDGPSHYSREFRDRFFASQAARMQTLIADATQRLEAIVAGKGRYPDDDMVLIPGGGPPSGGIVGAVHLYVLDPTIEEIMSTQQERRLLCGDGVVRTQIVRSILAPDSVSARLSRTFRHGTKQFTLTSFLSANAVRARNAVDDIDECSTNNSTHCALPHVSVPLLIMGMGASILIRDAERFEAIAGSADRELIYVQGADHWYGCYEHPVTGQCHPNATRNLFDHAAAWIGARFA